MIFSGDYVHHAFWDTTLSKVMKIMKKLTNRFQEYFPHLTVLYTFGNHDEEPVNSFDDSINQNGSLTETQRLYHLASEIFPKLMYNPDADVTSTLRRGGYYSYMINECIMAIVLQNNGPFNYNPYILRSPLYMKLQLQWLQTKLLEAEKTGLHVLLIYHVPLNEPFCWRIYARELRRIISRF